MNWSVSGINYLEEDYQAIVDIYNLTSVLYFCRDFTFCQKEKCLSSLAAYYQFKQQQLINIVEEEKQVTYESAEQIWPSKYKHKL